MSTTSRTGRWICIGMLTLLGTSTSEQLVAQLPVLAAPDRLVSADNWPDHDSSCGDQSSNTPVATPAACPTLYCTLPGMAFGIDPRQIEQLLGWESNGNEK